MKCSVRGCNNSSRSKGWCKPHYDAWRRYGDAHQYRDRSKLSLWDKILEIGWTIDPKTKCKNWNGHLNWCGYGQFRNGNGPLIRVHRIIMERKLGRKLSRKEHVLHKCDNPSCGNDRHLFIGSQFVNMKDMRNKKRGYKDNWTHCPNGHEYPTDRPRNISSNRCRICANERNRKYLARKANRTFRG